jgi:hypothetical protein
MLKYDYGILHKKQYGVQLHWMDVMAKLPWLAYSALAVWFTKVKYDIVMS